MALAGIAIGSNLGSRQAHIESAVLLLREVLAGLRLSRIVETAPVGVPGPQGNFLNAAAAGTYGGTAAGLMAELLRIERDHGRERPYPGAPRTLDLDLIFLGDQRIDDPGLVVPHPRFRERRFVLEPLAEVAPDWRDPVTGLTVLELLDRLRERP